MARPIRIFSGKDLEREFATVDALFQKKETEQNWGERDQAWQRLRQMLRSDVHEEYSDVFMAHLKMLTGHVVQSMNSLRTTLALTSHHLLGDLAVALKTSLDPYMDTLMVNLLKTSNSAKKLVSQASANASKALIENTSYHVRILQTLQTGMSDKNVQLRALVAGYIKVFVETHGTSRHEAMDRTGGTEILQQCLAKGAKDANPIVREICREVFVQFWELWPQRAQKMLDGFEPGSKKQIISKLGPLYMEMDVKPRMGLKAPPSNGVKPRPASTIIPRPTRVDPGRPPSRTDSVVSAPNKSRSRSSSIGRDNAVTANHSTGSMSHIPVASQRAKSPPKRASTMSTVPESGIPAPSSRLPMTRGGAAGMKQRPMSMMSVLPSAGMQPRPTMSARSPPASMKGSANLPRGISPASSTRSLSPSAPSNRVSATTIRRSITTNVSSPPTRRPASSQSTHRPASSHGVRYLDFVSKLMHNDPRQRLQGFDDLYDELRSPDNRLLEYYETGALPPREELEAMVMKLFSDPSVEVQRAVTEPDALLVIEQIVPLDKVVLRSLAMDSVGGADKPTGLVMRRLKQNIPEHRLAQVLIKCITQVGDRRRVTESLILWISDMIEDAQRTKTNAVYQYFQDKTSLKRYITRLIPFYGKRHQLSEEGQYKLADALYNLRCIDEPLFNNVLLGFDEAEAEEIRLLMQDQDFRAEEINRMDAELEMAELERHEAEEAMYRRQGYDEEEIYANETELSIYRNAHLSPHQMFDNSIENIYDQTSGNLVGSDDTANIDYAAMGEVLPPDLTEHPLNGSYLPQRSDGLNVIKEEAVGNGAGMSQEAIEQRNAILQAMSELREDPACRLTYRKLIKLVKDTNEVGVDRGLSDDVWGPEGELCYDLIGLLLQHLSPDTSATVKEHSIALLEQLIVSLTEMAEWHVQEILHRLLMCRLDSEHPGVTEAAEAAMEILATYIKPTAALEAMLDIFASDILPDLEASSTTPNARRSPDPYSAPISNKQGFISLAYKTLTQFLKRQSTEQPFDFETAGRIFEVALKDVNPHIRMCSLGVMHQLYVLLGEDCMRDNFLYQLTPNQLGLLNTFIHRFGGTASK